LIQIREFNINDSEQVISMIQGILDEIFGEKADRVLLEQGFFSDSGRLFVAEENGKIIGSAGVIKFESGIARLKRMYVLKEYRGKGVAQLLYDRAEQFAREKGYTKIILSTYPEMAAAQKFYEKNGFIHYRKDTIRNKVYYYKMLS
jgi:GNAT superfamily N-acetyltransferase